MIPCREAPAKRMRDGLKNVLHSSTSFMHGDIVRTDLHNKAMGKRLAKVTLSNSQRTVVVESLGFGRYTLQDLGEPIGTVLH